MVKIKKEPPEHKIVYQSPGRKKFLTVKKVGNFYYTERLGKDSIAFILYDKKRYPKFGMVHEPKDPLDTMMTTAFGGSLDMKGKGVKEVTQMEVKEESGYKVDLDRIKFVGKKLVSTQMNQMVYLFLVDVTGLKAGPRDPQSEGEKRSKVVWQLESEILRGPDMKAPAILALFNQISLPE